MGENGSDSKRVTPKLRCPICNCSFVPRRANAKTCSEKCSKEYSKRCILERYHKQHPNASYGKRGRAKAESPNQSSNVKEAYKGQSSTSRIPLDNRSARAKIKDLLRTPEKPNEITKEEKQEVNRIMALPVEERWNAGSKNWTPAQHKYAQKIEIKRISVDFSSIFSSFNQQNYTPTSLFDSKNGKDGLPYKYDVLADDSESSTDSSESSTDDEYDNQNTEDSQHNELGDEELDETDEENQF